MAPLSLWYSPWDHHHCPRTLDDELKDLTMACGRATVKRQNHGFPLVQPVIKSLHFYCPVLVQITFYTYINLFSLPDCSSTSGYTSTGHLMKCSFWQLLGTPGVCAPHLTNSERYFRWDNEKSMTSWHRGKIQILLCQTKSRSFSISAQIQMSKKKRKQQWSHTVASWVASTDESCVFKPEHNMLLISAVSVKAAAVTQPAGSLHGCIVSFHSISVWHSFGWLTIHFSSFVKGNCPLRRSHLDS